MNLFEDIQWKNGETLASAALRYLLLRSPAYREKMISVVSRFSPVGPIRVNNCFSIMLEVQTEAPDAVEEQRKYGFLDIVMETDDAVIGIENKFNAQFQPDQPKKYVLGLEKRAKALSPLRGGSDGRHCLLVLGPKSRKSEVERTIRAQGIDECTAFLAWEHLLDELSNHSSTDRVDEYLLQELRDYVNAQIGFPSDIRHILPHLRRPFARHGAQLQCQMVRSLWSIFDESLYAESYNWGQSPNSYYGYYLKQSAEAPYLWYGFVSDPGFGPETKFIFAIKRLGEELEGEHIEQIRTPPAGWDQWSVWEGKFGDDWADQAQWEKAVRPFNRRFRDLGSLSKAPERQFALG